MSPLEKGVMWAIVLMLVGYAAYVVMQGAAPEQPVNPEDTGKSTGEVPAEWLLHENASAGFSVNVPPGYSVDEMHTSLHHEDIAGVSFVVPADYTAGNNLSTDTRIAIEYTPVEDVSTCSAEIFLSTTAASTTVTDRGVVYSFAETSDAGAGNRYEEYVYALAGTERCFAVHYYIHSTLAENYPEDTVVPFDRNALMRTFNAIRHTLVVE